MNVALLLSFVFALYGPETIAGFRVKHRKSGSRPKILCLHGGGQTPEAFRGQAGMPALQNALPNFEFIFVAGRDAPGNGGRNGWILDPPGGKNNPTTDPEWASAAVNYLNEVVQNQGPFYGILGYSQGSAMAGLYLSIVPPGTFQVAMLFCGYIPTTHLGLVQRIEEGSPIGTRALVFMGQRDYIISNGMTRAQAAKFISPVVVTSGAAGHHVPYSSDPTFNQVVSFLTGEPVDSPNPLPTPAPTSAPGPAPLSCPSFARTPKPDGKGDCVCPAWQYCTKAGKTPDCPFSGGVGDWNGRFRACSDCKCQSWW